MFLERKLKDQSVWINIDSDSFKKNARIYQDYEIDKETIEYALDKNERLTWTTIVRMELLSLSTMSLI